MTISIFYAIEFENIQSNYVENADDILIEKGESLDVILGKFIWEDRGFEMIILAFILLIVYAGISVQIRKSKNKGGLT
jgi:hypothetical protein